MDETKNDKIAKARESLSWISGALHGLVTYMVGDVAAEHMEAADRHIAIIHAALSEDTDD